MGFMRPSVSDPPKPTNSNMDRGKTRNPPTYLEMGGFTSASKGAKKNSKMQVKKPESGSGPSVSRK